VAQGVCPILQNQNQNQKKKKTHFLTQDILSSVALFSIHSFHDYQLKTIKNKKPGKKKTLKTKNTIIRVTCR
jgi:hypothetical protein